jgi:8-oxo-dGTP pyrophosphatase MutT (NUDIX family)
MDIADLHFEHIYNKKVLQKLTNLYGYLHQYHLELEFSSQSMLDLMEKMNKKQRRGEVVMVVPDKQNQIWLHTKPFYPNGVYRLMTGGLDPGEKPDAALKREVREETGFKVDIDRCLAAITYTLRANEQVQPFVSYVFLTKRTKTQPQPLDTSENITGFQAVPVAALAEVASALRSLEGDFADWGRFRAVAHEVVHELLQA